MMSWLLLKRARAAIHAWRRCGRKRDVAQGGYLQVVSVGVIGSSAGGVEVGFKQWWGEGEWNEGKKSKILMSEKYINERNQIWWPKRRLSVNVTARRLLDWTRVTRECLGAEG